MASTLVNPFYRLYELPWTTSAEDDDRFRKILAAALLLVVALALIIHFVTVKNEPHEVVQEVPPRLAKLMIENKPRPPPPPPKIEHPNLSPRRRSSRSPNRWWSIGPRKHAPKPKKSRSAEVPGPTGGLA